jgi:4-hydroxy-tetrahydrodipicolinate reductase
VAATVRIGIAGALGRMGRAVALAAEAKPGVEIAAVYDRPGTEGQPVEHDGMRGQVLVTREQALAACDAIIDFTTPEATVGLAHKAIERGGPALILGSTGLTAEQEAEIAKAAAKLPVVRTLNFSLGVNMLIGLVEQTARRLAAADWDIEVFEAHHHRKVDAPSGTALMLGEAAARGRNVRLTDVADRGRDGITGVRKPGTIGFTAMRGGGIVGEHSVVFAAEDEILTLSHSARDRSLLARGAVEAALWAAGRPAGLYTMMDVLGFSS